jgi:predicted NAD/FAD-dependent oxidoreductase
LPPVFSGLESQIMRIAIVGAGISGLACADSLAGQGHEIVLLDKGRGPGGRMSTRRVDVHGRSLRFDHGAQYFTVRDPAFAAQAAGWEHDGVAARWPEAGADAWVGTPGMNAPIKAMAAGHVILWGTRVEALSLLDGQWHLAGAAEVGSFDAAVVAVPAEQAGSLLRPVQPDFGKAAARVHSAPCWTAMIAFREPVRTSLQIIRNAGPLGWAARDGAKPKRDDADTWVLQASPNWSSEQLETSHDEIGRKLLGLLEAELDVELPEYVYLYAHRWRYARTGARNGPGALWDGVIRIGACGDWLLAPRVEAAWLSGRCLASLIG